MALLCVSSTMFSPLPRVRCFPLVPVHLSNILGQPSLCHPPNVPFLERDRTQAVSSHSSQHIIIWGSDAAVGEHGVMKPTKSFGFFSPLAQHIGHRPSASPHHHQCRPSASTSTTHGPTPNAPSSQTKKRRKIISETDGNSFKRFQKQDCLSACGHADIGGRA